MLIQTDISTRFITDIILRVLASALIIYLYHV